MHLRETPYVPPDRTAAPARRPHRRKGSRRPGGRPGGTSRPVRPPMGGSRRCGPRPAPSRPAPVRGMPPLGEEEARSPRRVSQRVSDGVPLTWASPAVSRCLGHWSLDHMSDSQRDPRPRPTTASFRARKSSCCPVPDTHPFWRIRRGPPHFSCPSPRSTRLERPRPLDDLAQHGRSANDGRDLLSRPIRVGIWWGADL